jgi:hypothetical protein
MRAAFHHAGEIQRTDTEWDSKAFPYTHNALKGDKWNMFGYGPELLPILSDLDIDIQDRGMDKD